MFIKKQLATILAIVLLITAVPTTFCFAQTTTPETPEPIKILFVGNSLTYYNNMPGIFKGISEANEVNVEVDTVTSGSYYLSYFANEANSYGKLLREKLNKTSFDYVVIQAQSSEFLRMYKSSSLPAASTLVDLARDNGATPIFYMTWGLEDGYSFFYGDGTKVEYTYDTMTDALSDAYYTLGNELGVKVAPVGQNFRIVRTLYPDFDMFDPDGKHPDAAGSYVAACTIYNTIFEDYDFPNDEASYKSTCLGAPYWYTEEDEDNILVDIYDIDEETASAIQEVCDIRMSGSASSISLPSRGTTYYKSTIKASSTNELFNDVFADGTTIKYESTDEEIVTVKENTGKISALKGGTAYVRATSDFGLSTLATVEVKQPAKGITLSDESLTIVRTKTAQLTATISPEDTTNQEVTWESSNPEIATVDENGLVTALYPGTCDITATTHNGYNATCSIVVKLAKPKALEITKQTSTKGNDYSNHVLNWSAVSYAAKYLVYRSTSEDGTFTKIATVTNTTYTDKNVKRGTRYYYKVFASVGVLAYRSSASDIVSFKVPERLNLISAARTKASKKKYIKLTWKSQSDISGYKIYRANSKNGKYSLIKTITNTSKSTFTDKTTVKKKTYYYKVRSYVTINGKKIFSQYSVKLKVKKA